MKANPPTTQPAMRPLWLFEEPESCCVADSVDRPVMEPAGPVGLLTIVPAAFCSAFEWSLKGFREAWHNLLSTVNLNLF